MCPHGEGSYGSLQGVQMGRGPVRLSTHPDCPTHAKCQHYTAEAEREYKRTHPWATTGRYCPIHKTKGCPK